MLKSSEIAALRKLDAQMRKDLGPAEVSLDVIEFKDVLAAGGPAAQRGSSLRKSRANCHGSRARMTLTNRHPLVRIEPAEPNTLKIGSPGATLRFTVSPDAYYPVGISFLLLEGVAKPDDQARLGLLNFDQSQIRRLDHVLYVTDTFNDEIPYDRYKFSVIIQRARDGALGIIDPDIVHES
jgi:hypothetical protein